MPKVKIVRVWSRYDDKFDDSDPDLANEDLSEWLEVSQDELNQLSDYRIRDKILKSITNGYGMYTERIVVYEQLPKKEVKARINSVKELLSEIQKKESAQKKKDELAAKKRKEANRLKRIEKAKKLLEESGEL